VATLSWFEPSVFMMILRLSALSALAFILFSGVSCDSHSWEETRVLHGHGGDHGGKADAHGADAAKKEAHGTDAAKKDH
jgi:hypothetical protein